MQEIDIEQIVTNSTAVNATSRNMFHNNLHLPLPHESCCSHIIPNVELNSNEDKCNHEINDGLEVLLSVECKPQ